MSKMHPTLEEVKEQFAQWRRDKKGREKIPEALWAAAVSQTRRQPVFKVTEALRLNYNDLKERACKIATEASSGPAFVELKPVSAVMATECVIEIEKPGAKMKITLKGGFDTLELTKSFWGISA